ncbi:AsmA family protein [Porticoccus sp.]
MKFLKIVLLVAVVLLVVVIGGVTFLLIGVDPNSYKPELEKLARDNGVELRMEGDLGWSFFPNLAVHAGSTSLAGIDDSAGIPDVRFNEANFILDWKALLARKVRLAAIAVDGADIRAKTAAEAANVAALPGAAAATGKSESSALPFEVAIDKMSLTNSRITLVTPGAPDRVFEQLNFSSEGLNLDNKPFSLSLQFSTQLPDQPNPFALSLTAEAALQLEPQQISLSDAKLTLKGLDKLPLSLSFNARYDGSSDSLRISDLNGSLGSANISGAISGEKIQTAPALKGQLSLQNLLLKELPIEPPEGFSKVNLSTGFAASEQAVSLDNLKLALDDFNLTGKLAMQLPAPRQLEMSLNGGNLVLPASEAATAEQQAALFTPLLAPLALLEGGKGHVEINLASVTADTLRVDKLHLNLFANGKVVQISDLSGDVFGGNFKVDAKADLRKKTPAVTFTKQLSNIDLHQALTTLAEQQDIHGHLTMDFSGSSQGDTSDALMANMNGSGKFSFTDLQVDNINVEKSYCEMASLVEGKTLTGRSWPNYTRLQAMQGTIQWRDQQISLPGFTTGIGNLAVSGNGGANLVKESYDMLISAKLQGDTTSETGCTIKSKTVQNKAIPFRCTGSFAENGSGKCLPDKQFINQLIQGKIQEKLFDKFLKQPEAAPATDGTTTEETAPAEPVDPKQQLMEGLLKGLFN